MWGVYQSDSINVLKKEKKNKNFFLLLIPLVRKNCFCFIIFSNEWMVILKRPTFKEGSKTSWPGKNPCTLLSMYIIFNNDSYERTFNASKVFFFFLSIIKSFPVPHRISNVLILRQHWLIKSMVEYKPWRVFFFFVLFVYIFIYIYFSK